MVKLKCYFVGFWRYRYLLYNLISRDFKLKYRRSVLGVAWSVLNPLLMMLVMWAVFGGLFPDLRGGDILNYPIFLLCGQLLFNFFRESTTLAMSSVLNNAPLLRKVYIPKYIFPVSRVVSSFVTMTFSLAAVVLVMVFTRSPFYWTMLLFFIPLVFLFLFSCGMALLLSALTVYFRDMQHLFGILTLGWMYATPIFYPLEQLPPFAQGVMKLNPMYHYINMFRNLVMYGNIPGPNTWFACAASGAVMLALGLWVFHKLQRNFILYI